MPPAHGTDRDATARCHLHLGNLRQAIAGWRFSLWRILYRSPVNITTLQAVVTVDSSAHSPRSLPCHNFIDPDCSGQDLSRVQSDHCYILLSRASLMPVAGNEVSSGAEFR